jgi:hypothetical protein
MALLSGLPPLAAASLVLLFTASASAAGPGASPFAKGPYVQDLAATAAEVRVEVDPPSPVTLDLGGDAGGAGHFEHKQAAAFHVFPLTGLLPRTRYPYTVSSGPATKAASFTTAPPDVSTDSVKFLIYGDNRTDDSAHAAVVRAMASTPADFLLNTGDLVEHGGVPGLWQRFFEIEAPLLSTTCLFPTIGNHELVDKDASQYLRYFGPSAALSDAGAVRPPEIHRTFRWGFIRFFLLGGFGDASNLSDEKRWLESELVKADHEEGLTFRIVMTHHGAWSSGPHGRNAKLHDAAIVQAMRSHHVSLMLSGHDHIYERGQSEDLPYMVSGGGGAPSYELTDKLPFSRAFESVRHFVMVRSTPQLMTFTALRIDGSKIEECSLPASGGGWDCDKPATSARSDAGSAPSFVPSPTDVKTDTPRSSCSCSAIGAYGVSGPGASGETGQSPGHRDLWALPFLGLFLLGARRYARGRCASPRSSS